MSTPSRREAGQALARDLMQATQASGSTMPCAGLTRAVVARLEATFAVPQSNVGLAARDGRGDHDYWLDHGRSTGALMRRMAHRWGGNPELYYRVGFVHDLDYLRFPHDIHQTKAEPEGAHPVPLARAMHELGVHPAVTLAVLEHAPYIGVSDAPSSRLSAALSAAEDLATIAALVPPFDGLDRLSPDARQLLRMVKIRQWIHRENKVRVEANPERFVNEPLAQVVGGGPFRFDF